jgi:hypothetical protein
VSWFRRKAKQPASESHFLAEDDPLAAAVNRAWNTGEAVFWKEGDPLPKPDGPVRPVEDR